MKREQAMSCLKEIVALSRQMSPEEIVFEQSKNSDKSEGVRLHIKGALNTDKEAISRVAKNHDLVVEALNNDLIVYQPKVKAT